MNGSHIAVQCTMYIFAYMDITSLTQTKNTRMHVPKYKAPVHIFDQVNVGVTSQWVTARAGAAVPRSGHRPQHLGAGTLVSVVD